MRCKKARRLISASLDGELPAREQAFLATHLQQCPACSNQFSTLQGVRQLFRQSARCSAPPYLAQRVMAQLDTVDTRPLFAPLWRYLAEALVILMVIGFGVISGNLFCNNLDLRHPDPGLAAISREIFTATPAESLGRSYLAMLEVSGEK